MLNDKVKIRELKSYGDERGFLTKIFNYLDLKDKSIYDIYVTYTKGRQSRADHYHKKTTEWFCLLKGRIMLKLTDLKTKEEIEIELSDKKITVVEIPPWINHSVISHTNDEAILLAFGNQPYTKEDPDTYTMD